jgi:hypothetical protein
MALRRRQLLALLATGSAPALAGCTPCGETWTGVGVSVEPTAVERSDGWRVDAELTVNFNFGREGYGILAPALALFGRDGTLLTEAPVDDLMWSDVPESARESNDCGDYATVGRKRTLESDRFPKWVGIRFDEFRSGYDDPTTVSRYPDRTPESDVSAADYEMVDFESVGPQSPPVETGDAVREARFTRRPRTCEEPEVTVEAQTNVRLWAYGQRSIPAERYHPVLTGIDTNDDRLTAAIGIRSGPRLRRADCLRVPWSLSVEVTDPESMPSTLAIEVLDTDGEVTDTRELGVASETPET